MKQEVYHEAKKHSKIRVYHTVRVQCTCSTNYSDFNIVPRPIMQYCTYYLYSFELILYIFFVHEHTY